MFFGRIASLVMSYAAVVGVFAYMGIVSEWAFWILVGAYLLWPRCSPPCQGDRGDGVHRTDLGFDCGGLRRNPDSQLLRLLGYGS